MISIYDIRTELLPEILNMTIAEKDGFKIGDYVKFINDDEVGIIDAIYLCKNSKSEYCLKIVINKSNGLRTIFLYNLSEDFHNYIIKNKIVKELKKEIVKLSNDNTDVCYQMYKLAKRNSDNIDRIKHIYEEIKKIQEICYHPNIKDSNNIEEYSKTCDICLKRFYTESEINNGL